MSDNKYLFKWTGMDNRGHRTSGSLSANTANDAENELKKRGIEVITLQQSANRSNIQFSMKKKITQKNIMFFTRHLATMLSAGLPIIAALEIISSDDDNMAFKDLVTAIKNNTAEGKTLAESFGDFPKYFSPLYTNLVKSGEKSGTLEKTLLRLAVYMEKTESIKRKVKKALIYPAAILTIALGVSLILLLYVVPQFQSMFKTFGVELPFFTRMIVNVSNFLRSYWWMIIIFIALSIYMIKMAFREYEKLNFLMDRLKLKTYIVGDLLQKSIIARFARTLATTLEAGIPMVEAMQALSQIMGNRIYAKAVLKISDEVISGHQLSESMSATHLFPNTVIQMVSVGEASGRLGEMLHHVADYYEEEVNGIVDNLSSLLEPLIMLVLGVIVGGFVIAMYLPIFKMGALF